jgi:hypothetical protein
MRKGLYNRLMTQGGVTNPVIGLAMAEAVYPSRRAADMFKKPIVTPQKAAVIVEGFLDRRLFDLNQTIALLWGEGASPLDL